MGWTFRNIGPAFPTRTQSGSNFFYFEPGTVPSGYNPYPRQVTTSYRTGRGAPLEDSLVEDAFNAAPQLVAGEARFLKNLESIDESSFSKWDNGHTFDSTSSFFECSHPKVQLSIPSGTTYVGPLFINPFLTGVKWYAVPSASSLVAKYGPAAIAGTAPTNPASSGGQGLYELLVDGLPSIPKAGIGAIDSVWHSMRALAHGHLSIQFDWLPFIGDLKSTIHALKNANKLLRQYYRDSGRVVRRRMTFPVERVTQNLGTFVSPNIDGCIVAPPGIDTAKGFSLASASNQSLFIFHKGSDTALTETKVTTTEVWFSGAYQYFVPGDHDGILGALDGFEKKADHLLGLELTPSLLWQLAPWSWLLDWKSQIGNSIKNFTAFQKDSLVLRYGYLMVTQTIKHEVTLRGLYTRYDTAPRDPLCPSTTYTTVRKERFRATPYGFGINPSSFTARQWSILGALGMTRSPNKIRNDD